MPQAVSQAEVPQIIYDFLGRAKQEINLTCNAFLSFAGPPPLPSLRDILMGLPQDVPGRCIIGLLESEGRYADGELDRLIGRSPTSLAGALTRWDARTMFEWTGSHLLLIDRQHILRAVHVAWSGSPQWEYFLEDDPVGVKEYVDLFERTWKGAAPLSVPGRAQ